MGNETVSSSAPVVNQQPIDHTMSPSIGQLAEALSKAQGSMRLAKKDSENPFFNSKYADLSSVWEASREALCANNLAVIQTTSGGGDKAIKVITTLVHSSGEWIRGSLPLNPVKADPQGIGSAITYGRRYALAAIVGVAQEDDDGNSASRVKPKSDFRKDMSARTRPVDTKPKEDLSQRSDSPYWTSDFKGTQYINARTGNHFTPEFLEEIGMMKGKKQGIYYCKFDQTIMDLLEGQGKESPPPPSDEWDGSGEPPSFLDEI